MRQQSVFDVSQNWTAGGNPCADLYNMLLRILPQLLLIIQLAIPAHAAEDLPSELILYFKNEAQAKAASQKLPADFILIQQQFHLVLVKPAHLQSWLQLNKLKQLRGILRIAPNSTLHPSDRELRAGNAKSNPPAPSYSSESGAAPSSSCQPPLICSESGRNALWAQKALAFDLAEAEMHKNKVKFGITSVAILGSGFDIRGTAPYLNKDQVLSADTKALVNTDETDKIGHETTVGSLITGSQLTRDLTPRKLTSYAIANSEGQGNSFVAEILAIKACLDGHDLINISMSPTTEQIPNENALLMVSSSLDLLRERGCYVYQGVPNFKFRGNIKYEKAGKIGVTALVSGIDDGTFQPRADRMVGNLNAPWSNVTGLASQQTDAIQNSQTCSGDSRLSIHDGHSFSTPLVVRAAAYVNDVLYTSEPPMQRRMQAALREKILEYSSVNGAVNALSAVHLAQLIVNNKIHSVPDDRTLRNLWLSQPHPVCKAQLEDCTKLTSCMTTQTCENTLRMIASLCPTKSGKARLLGLQMAVHKRDLSSMAENLNALLNGQEKPFPVPGLKQSRNPLPKELVQQLDQALEDMLAQRKIPLDYADLIRFRGLLKTHNLLTTKFDKAVVGRLNTESFSIQVPAGADMYRYIKKFLTNSADLLEAAYEQGYVDGVWFGERIGQSSVSNPMRAEVLVDVLNKKTGYGFHLSSKDNRQALSRVQKLSESPASPARKLHGKLLSAVAEDLTASEFKNHFANALAYTPKDSLPDLLKGLTKSEVPVNEKVELLKRMIESPSFTASQARALIMSYRSAQADEIDFSIKGLRRKFVPTQLTSQHYQELANTLRQAPPAGLDASDIDNFRSRIALGMAYEKLGN